MIMSLVNGGALVDFRSRDGSTAVHRAVARNNAEALKVLLDLGASPNYKVSKAWKCISLIWGQFAATTSTAIAAIVRRKL